MEEDASWRDSRMARFSSESSSMREPRVPLWPDSVATAAVVVAEAGVAEVRDDRLRLVVVGVVLVVATGVSNEELKIGTSSHPSSSSAPSSPSKASPSSSSSTATSSPSSSSWMSLVSAASAAIF